MGLGYDKGYFVSVFNKSLILTLGLCRSRARISRHQENPSSHQFSPVEVFWSRTLMPSMTLALTSKTLRGFWPGLKDILPFLADLAFFSVANSPVTPSS